MKNNMRTGALLALLVVLMCTLLAGSAFAAKSTGGSGSGSGNAQLNSLPPFKFEIHKQGIGYGNCPVYSAPTTSAWRGANGKASVATSGHRVDEAGYVDGWLLVRYEVNKGWRVGYIPPKYVKNFKSRMSAHFGYIPATAYGEIYVTDNPFSHTDHFALMEEGEQFHVLSRYNYYAKNGYDWWYIECMVDGQVARGFIELNAPFTVD